MKVYVVMEYAVIEYEECERLMGVFSSKTKAKEAIATYEDWSKGSRWRHEYNYIECEVDQVWEQ